MIAKGDKKKRLSYNDYNAHTQ